MLMDRPARDQDDESFYFADPLVPEARERSPWPERASARNDEEPLAYYPLDSESWVDDPADRGGRAFDYHDPDNDEFRDDPFSGAGDSPVTDDELTLSRRGESIEESEFLMRLRNDHERSQREAAGRLYLGVSGWIGGLAIAGAPAIVAVARSYVLAHGDPQTMFTILRNVNIFALLSGYLFWMVTYCAIFLFALRRVVAHGDLSYDNSSEVHQRLRYRASSLLGALAFLLPVLLVPPAAWQPVAIAGVIAYGLVKVGDLWTRRSWARYADRHARVPRSHDREGWWMRLRPRRLRFPYLGDAYPVFWDALIVPLVIAIVGALTFDWMPLETVELAPRVATTTAYVLDVGEEHTQLLTPDGQIVILRNSTVQARAVCPALPLGMTADFWNRLLDQQSHNERLSFLSTVQRDRSVLQQVLWPNRPAPPELCAERP
ncbi:hypothetical protein ACFQGL_31955 [Micromonospora vulcania]|uniref:Uncharacterized protein n=2 Tax=Micromonospora vulcania TaxID=1441873 RepID=A0ABW1HI04_9ACTN